MNRLYFGDNLEILREMDDERVHLICTDPPFNSGRDYNSFIGDSLAPKKHLRIPSSLSTLIFREFDRRGEVASPSPKSHTCNFRLDRLLDVGHHRTRCPRQY